MVTSIIKEFLPNIQLRLASLNRFYDLDDNFFLLYISIYNEIIAPATRQNVIELIDLQFKNIKALEIIIISFAGF
jgi:hypothetical protein